MSVFHVGVSAAVVLHFCL